MKLLSEKKFFKKMATYVLITGPAVYVFILANMLEWINSHTLVPSWLNWIAIQLENWIFSITGALISIIYMSICVPLHNYTPQKWRKKLRLVFAIANITLSLKMLFWGLFFLAWTVASRYVEYVPEVSQAGMIGALALFLSWAVWTQPRKFVKDYWRGR